jgi:NAD(P)-dependent dehydrogenase (short-subunit alcohol dehydrogenase family)
VSRLTGRHALVTGGNRGIGAAIARALSHEGASVTLLVREPGAHGVGGPAPGPNAVVVADVTDREAVHGVHRGGGAHGTRRHTGQQRRIHGIGSFLKSGPELFNA